MTINPKYTKEDVAEALKMAEVLPLHPCPSCYTHIPLNVLVSAYRDAVEERDSLVNHHRTDLDHLEELCRDVESLKTRLAEVEATNERDRSAWCHDIQKLVEIRKKLARAEEIIRKKDGVLAIAEIELDRMWGTYYGGHDNKRIRKAAGEAHAKVKKALALRLDGEEKK